MLRLVISTGFSEDYDSEDALYSQYREHFIGAIAHVTAVRHPEDTNKSFAFALVHKDGDLLAYHYTPDCCIAYKVLRPMVLPWSWSEVPSEHRIVFDLLRATLYT